MIFKGMGVIYFGFESSKLPKQSFQTSIFQLTVDSELTQAFSAYALFLKGKKIVGIERAKYSIVFARGNFLDNEYNELVKLELEQDLYFHEFADLTSDELHQSFQALFNEQAFKSV